MECPSLAADSNLCKICGEQRATCKWWCCDRLFCPACRSKFLPQMSTFVHCILCACQIDKRNLALVHNAHKRACTDDNFKLPPEAEALAPVTRAGCDDGAGPATPSCTTATRQSPVRDAPSAGKLSAALPRAVGSVPSVPVTFAFQTSSGSSNAGFKRPKRTPLAEVIARRALEQSESSASTNSSSGSQNSCNSQDTSNSESDSLLPSMVTLGTSMPKCTAPASAFCFVKSSTPKPKRKTTLAEVMARNKASQDSQVSEDAPAF